MDRNAVNWRGYWPTAPTPFTTSGEVDDKAIRALMEHYVAAGVHGVLINGSSGEWWAQSAAERRHVAAAAVDAVAGRIPVVVGCTAFTAAEVVDLATHATEIGADGVLATPPPYVHPTQSEVFGYYRHIDRGITLPLVVYNWPWGTAVEIELDTARRIAGLEHVVAVKNSTHDWPLVVDYIEALADQVRIFASLINRRGLAIMSQLGGDGYIDGVGVGGPFAVPFFDAFWNGRIEEARCFADKYWQLTRSWINGDFSGRFGSPSSQLKAAMKLLGQPGRSAINVSGMRQSIVPVRGIGYLPYGHGGDENPLAALGGETKPTLGKKTNTQALVITYCLPLTPAVITADLIGGDADAGYAAASISGSSPGQTPRLGRNIPVTGSSFSRSSWW